MGLTRVLAIVLLALLVAPVASAAATPEVEKANPALDIAKSSAASAGHAIGAAASGTAHAGVAAAHGIGAVASAIGHATLAVGRALGHAIGLLAGLVGSLIGAGFRFVVAHPKESAIAAGSAGALATLYALARKFGALLFVPLYSRLAPSEMLDNEVRNRVYAHVKANPGAHPSAISEALAIGWGTTIYHLARLEDTKLLTHRTASNRKCYFAIGAELDIQGRDAMAAMGTDKAKAIVAALRAQPELSQKDLAERLGMSQALASWHVKRLVASGVLTTRRAGRSNLLAVAAHVPIAA